MVSLHTTHAKLSTSTVRVFVKLVVYSKTQSSDRKVITSTLNETLTYATTAFSLRFTAQNLAIVLHDLLLRAFLHAESMIIPRCCGATLCLNVTYHIGTHLSSRFGEAAALVPS